MTRFKYILPLFAILFSTLLSAQSLTVENGRVEYDDQNMPAIKVVMNPKPDKVKDEFRDYVKDNYDVKMKGIGFLSNKDVLSAEGTVISRISDKEMDFRAKVVERGDATEMYVFGSFGYDIFVDPEQYPNEYRAMKTLTVNFLNDFLPDYYKDRIDETQEMLSDLKEEREDLNDDIADNEKKIEELKKENEEKRNKLNEVEENISEAESKLNLRKDSLKKINRELIDNGR